MDDTTVLITGAAKRLGRATALALAADGVHVVIHYRDSKEAADAVAREAQELGVKAWTVRADLAEAGDAHALVDRARALAGDLHGLVNNASVFPAGDLAATALPALEETLRVNAWAPLLVARAFADAAPDGARVVNVLDTRVSGPPDGARVAYQLSKDALAAVTRLLAAELAPHVTVNAVAPGLVLPPEGEDDAYLERLAPRVALRRHGGSRDVTDAIRYLLGAGFVTGQVIFVDGGEHLGRREV